MTSGTSRLPDTATLALAVAALLGPEWSAHRDTDGLHLRAYCLRHRDGRQVRLAVHPDTTGPQCGRLYAAGVLPESPDDIVPSTTDIKCGRITMAGTKTAQQIADHITRRLLPTLTAAYATWHGKVLRLRALEARRMTVAEQLANVPGMSAPSRVASQYGSHFPWRRGWEGAARAPLGSRPGARTSAIGPSTNPRAEAALLRLHDALRPGYFALSNAQMSRARDLMRQFGMLTTAAADDGAHTATAGIPSYKIASNAGWIVTAAELRSALSAQAAPPALGTVAAAEIAAAAPWWPALLRYFGEPTKCSPRGDGMRGAGSVGRAAVACGDWARHLVTAAPWRAQFYVSSWSARASTSLLGQADHGLSEPGPKTGQRSSMPGSSMPESMASSSMWSTPMGSPMGAPGISSWSEPETLMGSFSGSDIGPGPFHKVRCWVGRSGGQVGSPLGTGWPFSSIAITPTSYANETGVPRFTRETSPSFTGRPRSVDFDLAGQRIPLVGHFTAAADHGGVQVH